MRYTINQTYRVETEHNYLVTITRLKNTVNGCPRVKAQVTLLDNAYNPNCLSTYTFNVKGFGNEQQKAEQAVYMFETHILEKQ